LYAREEIDAPPGAEDESMDKAIEAGNKVIDALNLSYRSGDVELGE